jgi:hypothetical protein
MDEKNISRVKTFANLNFKPLGKSTSIKKPPGKEVFLWVRPVIYLSN